MSLFLDTLLCSMIYVFVCMPVLYYFYYYSFVIQFENREYDVFSFVLLSENCFGYSGSFVVPYTF